MTRPWALLVVTAVATWLRSSPADACQIGTPTPNVEFPAEGETDIPTNAVLWLARDRVAEDDTFVLRTPDGSEIPLVTTRVSFGGSLFFVMRPNDDLEPNTRHEISKCSLGSCGGALRTFHTGDGPDLEPPAPPEEIDRESGVDRMVLCGGNAHWVEVDVEFEGILVADLEVPEFDEQTLSGRADWLMTDAEPLVFGDTGLGFGSPIHVRVGAFDQAGNFSGWVELEPIDVPGCGCSGGAGARSTTGWSLLAFLLGASARRRRRRATR